MVRNIYIYYKKHSKDLSMSLESIIHFCYNRLINCITCGKPMRKVRWKITNNFKVGSDFKEYDKYAYECRENDVWVTTEVPAAEKIKAESKKQP